MKNLKNYREKMSAHVNVQISKIMCSANVGVRKYAVYANC